MTGLAMLVQQGLAADPFDGAAFAFRGRRAGLITLTWHDGTGLCMLAKRLEQSQLVWPSASFRQADRADGTPNWSPCWMAASGGGTPHQ